VLPTFSFLLQRPHDDERGLFRSGRVAGVFLFSLPTTRRRKKIVPFWSCRWRSPFFSTDHTRTDDACSVLFVLPTFSFLLQRPHDDERGLFHSVRAAGILFERK